jgi:hypothetical protein
LLSFSECYYLSSLECVHLVNVCFRHSLIVICVSYCVIIKHGGLDSREQSRSRSRFLDTSRQGLKVSRFFSTVETSFFSVSVKIFKIETFESRFGYVKILIEIVKTFETSWDFWDLSRLVEISGHLLRFLDIFWILFIHFRHLLLPPFEPLCLSRVSIESTSRQIDTTKPSYYYNSTFCYLGTPKSENVQNCSLFGFLFSSKELLAIIIVDIYLQ